MIIALFLGMEGGTKKHLWEAYNLYMGYDGTYEISGMPVLDGKQAILDFFVPDQNSTDGVVKIVPRLHNIVVNGDNVFTERTDTYYDKDGGKITEIKVSGVMRLASGKIKRWADYCDARPLMELYADQLAAL